MMMDDDTDLGVALSVTCSTSMDDCYGEIDIDQVDGDPSETGNGLTFDFVDCDKDNISPSQVPLYYQDITPYSCMPDLIIEQLEHARQSDSESDRLDDPLLITEERLLVTEQRLIVSEERIIVSDEQLNNINPNLLEPPKPKAKRSRTSKRKTDNYTLDTGMQPSQMLITNDGGNFQHNAMKERKMFFCGDCGKSFKFQTSLLRHNNKVHNYKYQCPTCSRVFSRQAYLDVHTSKQGSTCYLGNSSPKSHKRSH